MLYHFLSSSDEQAEPLTDTEGAKGVTHLLRNGNMHACMQKGACFKNISHDPGCCKL